MINKKIGFIGAGNMGGAIIGGLIASDTFTREAIIASDASVAGREKIKNEFGIAVAEDNAAVARFADIILLAVKPNIQDAVIADIKDIINNDTLIISIAAGRTIEQIENSFGKTIKLVRVMPNLPAMVGASMNALCFNEQITDADGEIALAIFNSFGLAEVISEKLMDAVVGVSGSSPAYAFMMIEAMADAAVADGMPRSQAYTFAAQSVMGAAKMVLETGRHPADLKDAVCSPGGTTIEAVAVLEQMGFRTAIIEAQRACVDKSIEMSK